LSQCVDTKNTISFVTLVSELYTMPGKSKQNVEKQTRLGAYLTTINQGIKIKTTVLQDFTTGKKPNVSVPIDLTNGVNFLDFRQVYEKFKVGNNQYRDTPVNDYFFFASTPAMTKAFLSPGKPQKEIGGKWLISNRLMKKGLKGVQSELPNGVNDYMLLFDCLTFSWCLVYPVLSMSHLQTPKQEEVAAYEKNETRSYDEEISILLYKGLSVDKEDDIAIADAQGCVVFDYFTWSFYKIDQNMKKYVHQVVYLKNSEVQIERQDEETQSNSYTVQLVTDKGIQDAMRVETDDKGLVKSVAYAPLGQRDFKNWVPYELSLDGSWGISQSHIPVADTVANASRDDGLMNELTKLIGRDASTKKYAEVDLNGETFAIGELWDGKGKVVEKKKEEWVAPTDGFEEVEFDSLESVSVRRGGKVEKGRVAKIVDAIADMFNRAKEVKLVAKANGVQNVEVNGKMVQRTHAMMPAKRDPPNTGEEGDDVREGEVSHEEVEPLLDHQKDGYVSATVAETNYAIKKVQPSKLKALLNNAGEWVDAKLQQIKLIKRGGKYQLSIDNQIASDVKSIPSLPENLQTTNFDAASDVSLVIEEEPDSSVTADPASTTTTAPALKPLGSDKDAKTLFKELKLNGKDKYGKVTVNGNSKDSFVYVIGNYDPNNNRLKVLHMEQGTWVPVNTSVTVSKKLVSSTTNIETLLIDIGGKTGSIVPNNLSDNETVKEALEKAQNTVSVEFMS